MDMTGWNMMKEDLLLEKEGCSLCWWRGGRFWWGEGGEGREGRVKGAGGVMKMTWRLISVQIRIVILTIYSGKHKDNIGVYSGKYKDNIGVYSGKQKDNIGVYSGKHKDNIGVYSRKHKDNIGVY